MKVPGEGCAARVAVAVEVAGAQSHSGRAAVQCARGQGTVHGDRDGQHGRLSEPHSGRQGGGGGGGLAGERRVDPPVHGDVGLQTVPTPRPTPTLKLTTCPCLCIYPYTSTGRPLEQRQQCGEAEDLLVRLLHPST